MNKSLLGGLLLSLFSVNALGNCDIWDLKVENTVTGETKNYTYYAGDIKTLPIPLVKNYQCVFSIAKQGGGTSATLACSRINSKVSTLTVGSCLDGTGSGLLSILDGTKKKMVGYIFSFTTE